MSNTYRDSRGLISAVRPKVDEVLDKFSKITHVWGPGTTPDHNNLRCCDFMVGNQKSLGDDIAAYLIDNADRLGVQGIIWNRRLWRNSARKGGQYTRSPQRSWDKYTGPSPHTDHVHVQFDARKIDGAPASPSPAPSPGKSVSQLATEVIAGKWGNGDERRRRLGSKYKAVQAEVNKRLAGDGKSVSQLATEVIAGKWGNGDERRRRLGSKYKAVQAEVNRRLA